MDTIEEFRNYREKMNKRLLATDNKIIKRLFSIDSMTYEDGALPASVKEMLGLATSLVLRCDDCVKYHLEQCHKLGITTQQVTEVFVVCNVVGGSIAIPHTRRALEYWDMLTEKQ
ncbi:MAG TPA: carboxymuconolactone decarboxylase family protein [Bacteroidales bacterium]|nr:carboxymuconolactone decarboxylase family protein [Bacteroidales bacterium]